MADKNTLLNYELALEMKWFQQALMNQSVNYAAACEFYKTLLYFKNIDEEHWPDPPILSNHDNQGNFVKLEKYYFSLQNLYAIKARDRIDAIRESYKDDKDIPEIIQTKVVNEISI